MNDLSVGDRVYDEQGTVFRVVRTYGPSARVAWEKRISAATTRDELSVIHMELYLERKDVLSRESVRKLARMIEKKKAVVSQAHGLIGA